LTHAITCAVNKSLDKLEKKLGLERGEIKRNIYDIVAVGNSTMRSIFFSQDDSEICKIINKKS